jgi:hypothetical protein
MLASSLIVGEFDPRRSTGRFLFWCLSRSFIRTPNSQVRAHFAHVGCFIDSQVLQERLKTPTLTGSRVEE